MAAKPTSSVPQGGTSILWVHALALLWQNLFVPVFFKDLFSAVWAPLRRRPKDETDDGVTYGGHG
ncbi:hypothetical protein, partial [Bradyrhizobium uaiense]|uniref:hypothetical protein n=1 Tax=Bradyrhizobium uaiense TaxID=2594946 RepID=UPI0019D69C27